MANSFEISLTSTLMGSTLPVWPFATSTFAGVRSSSRNSF